MVTKKGTVMKFFLLHPSLLLLFLDPGSKIKDPGRVKIRIWDKLPGSATLLVIYGLKQVRSTVSDLLDLCHFDGPDPGLLDL